MRCNRTCHNCRCCRRRSHKAMLLQKRMMQLPRLGRVLQQSLKLLCTYDFLDHLVLFLSPHHGQIGIPFFTLEMCCIEITEPDGIATPADGPSISSSNHTNLRQSLVSLISQPTAQHLTGLNFSSNLES